MEQFISSLICGISVGLLYVLVAVGFTLIFGVAKILFLTHGQIYMIGSVFAYYFIRKIGIPYVFGALIVMVLTGIIGLLIERFLRPLKGNPTRIMIVTLAVSMIISDLMLYIFGTIPKSLPPMFSGRVNIFGAGVSGQWIAVMLISLSAVVCLHLFIKKTKIGQAMIAVSLDKEAAVLMGINIERSLSVTFFLACASSGLAGMLVAPIYFVDIFSGTPALLRTFVVVVLGGLGSIYGSVLGGIFLGLVESFGFIYVGGLSTLISFFLAIAMIILRPQGFLGRE